MYLRIIRIRVAALVLWSLWAYGQFHLESPDGRQVALANSDLVSGLWANPGIVLPAGSGSALHMYGSRFPFVPGLGFRSAQWLHLRDGFNFGAGAIGFGDALFNRQDVSLLTSHRIGSTSIGTRILYDQIRSPNRVSRGLSMHLGSVTEISKMLRVGLVLENPGFLQWGETEAPVRLSAGMRYDPSKALSLFSAVRKDLHHRPIWQSAMELQVKRGFTFRSGFQLYPVRMTAGFGFHYWRLTADYAYLYARHTGGSFHATARYMWKGGKGK